MGGGRATLELGASQRGFVETLSRAETHSTMASKKQQQVCLRPPCARKGRVFADQPPGNGAGRFVSIQTTKLVSRYRG